SCAPEVYRLSVHALYVYIATSYAVEQTLQPVITVARMWAASITSVALPSAFCPRMDPSLNTSDRDATSCRRRGIVKRCTTAARVGRTSRVRSGRPHRPVGSNYARNLPAVAWWTYRREAAIRRHLSSIAPERSAWRLHIPRPHPTTLVRDRWPDSPPSYGH